MSLETLLEAAKYVEYRSEAKARGEEPHDYHTFTKLCSATKDGGFQASSPTPQRRQTSLSNSSHSSDEVKERRRPSIQIPRDMVPHEHSGSGTREVHNKLEKNRRAHLKECFEALKRQLPNMDDRKTSNLSILRGAIRFIQVLKRKEREYEHDMERLAREKIAFQQRLSILKKDLSSQLDHIDPNNFIHEDDNETTTTASECGALSDFDDTPPQENSTMTTSTSDLTSSSSSLTVNSGIIMGPTSTVASTSTIVFSKQSASVTQRSSHSRSASPREPPPISHHYPHETHMSASSKASVATPVPMAHQINNTDGNTAQTTRVFPAGNIHTMAGIFASPHAMQVITQPSGIKVITAPNSFVASSSNVQHIAVSHHQHGQIHVLAPSTNPSYSSSISAATSKSFSTDSLVQVPSSNSKSISKPHLVSPLALVNPQTVVNLSHNSMAKSHPTGALAGPELHQPGTLNLSQKGTSVISGNVAMAVKGGLPPNSVVVSGTSHSNMLATLQMSKSHPQVIQPTLTSSIIAQGGSHVNSGSHHAVSSGLKPLASNPVRSLPHLTGLTHVVVSQSPITAPVGQIVTPHVSAVTPLVGSVSVVSHTGAVHQQSIGKVIASPVLKPVNQINQIPIIQQQFLQQVSVGSTAQPIVKPVVVMSMPNMVPSNAMPPLTPSSLVQISEPPSAVRGAAPQK